MKILVALTCIAIIAGVGQMFRAEHQDDKFQKALAEISATEKAAVLP